jgi:hypothetical protein
VDTVKDLAVFLNSKRHFRQHVNYTFSQALKFLGLTRFISCPATAMQAPRGEKYNSYSFLISALDGGEWSASRPGRALPPGNDPGINCTGGWVGLRAGLDTEVRGKILCLCRGSNPGRPVRSQTLY